MNCGFSVKSPAKGLGVRVGRGLRQTLASRPQEWPDPKDWSLQDTDAFVLVYDICSPDSFDYVKALRQRIAETRWELARNGVWGGGECLWVWLDLCLR